jgi:uncharacterized glyoxalase superfamily protein PhnB
LKRWERAVDHTICHLTFKGRCLEAFEQYAELLGGSVEEVSLLEAHGPLVELAVLRIQDCSLTGHDQHAGVEIYDEVALMLCTGTRDEAWSLYGLLAVSGHVTTPMGETRWAELAGGLIDRYGTAWIVCHGIHDGTARLFARSSRMTLDVLPLDRSLADSPRRTRRVLHQQTEDEQVPVFMHQEVRRASTVEVVRRP